MANEPDVSRLMSVRQAIAIIDAIPVTPRAVVVPLMESIGLHLATEIRADRDYPPFKKSLMDGYAVRAADVAGDTAELEIAGHITAGQTAPQPLEPGHAMAIMTGAPIPTGADSVVPVEQTQSLVGGKRIAIRNGSGGERYIAAAGSDIRKNAVLLPAGALMTPAAVAAAASVGAARVSVYRAPSVAVLGTGDEIIPFDQTPGPAQIRGSNNPMLIALLQKFRCVVHDLGHQPDDPATISAAIAEGLKQDAVFITGGMSMGDRDYVPGILKQLGAEFQIRKLRIKPGKPFAFATMPNGRFAFGLPGNPVSAFVCTLRLASRLLMRMAGGNPADFMNSAPLSAPLPANGAREFYQPAILTSSEVAPLAWKGSADIYTLARATHLIVRPENDPERSAGDIVEIIPL